MTNFSKMYTKADIERWTQISHYGAWYVTVHYKARQKYVTYRVFWGSISLFSNVMKKNDPNKSCEAENFLQDSIHLYTKYFIQRGTNIHFQWAPLHMCTSKFCQYIADFVENCQVRHASVSQNVQDDVLNSCTDRLWDLGNYGLFCSLKHRPQVKRGARWSHETRSLFLDLTNELRIIKNYVEIFKKGTIFVKIATNDFDRTASEIVPPLH